MQIRKLRTVMLGRTSYAVPPAEASRFSSYVPAGDFARLEPQRYFDATTVAVASVTVVLTAIERMRVHVDVSRQNNLLGKVERCSSSLRLDLGGKLTLIGELVGNLIAFSTAVRANLDEIEQAGRNDDEEGARAGAFRLFANMATFAGSTHAILRDNEMVLSGDAYAEARDSLSALPHALREVIYDFYRIFDQQLRRMRRLLEESLPAHIGREDPQFSEFAAIINELYSCVATLNQIRIDLIEA
ncbi:hypothetical protein L2D00_06920 [Hyphomonadaceae bacterium BL14]|nr:hypothetical protein L2D00_06920 [Hyphomonadaceae bacterium BL14]